MSFTGFYVQYLFCPTGIGHPQGFHHFWRKLRVAFQPIQGRLPDCRCIGQVDRRGVGFGLTRRSRTVRPRLVGGRFFVLIHTYNNLSWIELLERNLRFSCDDPLRLTVIVSGSNC